MFKKNNTVIGKRLDFVGSQLIEVPTYYTVQVWDWVKISITVTVATLVTIVMAVMAMLVLSGDTDDTQPVQAEAPVTTVTEVPEVTIPVIETTTIPTPAVEYVCNIQTNSKEYTSMDDEFVWEDGVTRDIDWSYILRFDIVLVWTIDDDAKLMDFMNDIELFNMYTNANIRVEREGYVARANDFIIPVVMEDLPGSSWAWMETGVQVSAIFGAELVDVVSAKFTMDPKLINNWNTHTRTVLHEMGHLFGLGHTHDAEGQQTDSVMSYESDYSVKGYLPGDIAGLKEVFCK